LETSHYFRFNWPVLVGQLLNYLNAFNGGIYRVEHRLSLKSRNQCNPFGRANFFTAALKPASRPARSHSEIPDLRHTSEFAVPSSACFKIKTICDSVKLLFFIEFSFSFPQEHYWKILILNGLIYGEQVRPLIL
jgi:hypothetical protein